MLLLQVLLSSAVAVLLLPLLKGLKALPETACRVHLGMNTLTVTLHATLTQHLSNIGMTGVPLHTRDIMSLAMHQQYKDTDS